MPQATAAVVLYMSQTEQRTAIRSPGLPFNGLHPRNPRITTHLPTPSGWKAELAWLVDP